MAAAQRKRSRPSEGILKLFSRLTQNQITAYVNERSPKNDYEVIKKIGYEIEEEPEEEFRPFGQLDKKVNSYRSRNTGSGKMNESPKMQSFNRDEISEARYSLNSNSRTSNNRQMIATVIYLTLLLDNVLLTVIVPILPHYLASMNRMNTSQNYTSLIRVVAENVNKPNSVFTVQYPTYYHREDTNATLLPIMTKHPILGKSINTKFSPLRSENHNEMFKSFHMNAHNRDNRFNGPENNKSTKGALTSYNTSVDEMRQGDNEASKLIGENSSIGILLAMKALLQLIFNPIVGSVSCKFGYHLPIIAGTICLLISSLAFAVGVTYADLLIARAIQGIGSACINICGMSLIAQNYPEEDRRSKIMGIVLGSIALGVLMGYPFGGILYDLYGKTTPLIILATVIFICLGMQLIIMDLSTQSESLAITDMQHSQSNWKLLLKSKIILALILAIWFSTSVMAVLEPCLPIWLMQHLKPTRWQLGTVFIPDSVGYFVGTNFFGSIAYKYGQVKIACVSMILIGISAMLIPRASSVAHLLVPHFGLGLGIGIVDAALVPLLAKFMDDILFHEEPTSLNQVNPILRYGNVYAIQQTSVSLAYFLAPLIGGELAQAIGFDYLMRTIGAFNILYGSALLYSYQMFDPKLLREKQNEMLLNDSGYGTKYRQLYDTLELK
ncbi:synaptic vesicular amine transporter [Glossina fuscipes]|uniref:Synaptic vesicular amine transporter n=1 Tax=Glossina fuscipes TaxID=7396 RepID=A0A9C5ZDW9_9MUSC|nr:synaptic vesicular amine transporter [Glossina fuscipes]